MAIRLKENHPIFKQLDEIYATMEKFGISIGFHAGGKVILRSNEHGEFHLLDFENVSDYHSASYVSEFPPALEYKLVREE